MGKYLVQMRMALHKYANKQPHTRLAQGETERQIIHWAVMAFLTLRPQLLELGT